MKAAILPFLIAAINIVSAFANWPDDPALAIACGLAACAMLYMAGHMIKSYKSRKSIVS